MRVKRVTIYDFDNFENSSGNALHVTETKMFVDNEQGTAHRKADDYIRSLDLKHYLGWDENVYPKIVVTDEPVN